MARKPTKHAPIPVLALLLAWLVPGAGHVYMGRLARGIIIFVTIAATFWAGVALGGVMTVDHHYERWWFVAQMCSGAHGVVAWYHEQHVYSSIIASLREKGYPVDRQGTAPPQSVVDEELQQRNMALVAPMDTVARAYAGVAGLLNVMCIFDAFMLSFMGAHKEAPAGAGSARTDKTDATAAGAGTSRGRGKRRTK